jgi:release factor glutamine methyltransferase
MDRAVHQALHRASDHLNSAGVDQASLDAELLLAEVMQERREQLHAYPERKLPQEVYSQFWEWVKRRAAREPVAYILGRKEFWSLEFEVSPAVLIPRPETELMVESVLEWQNSRSDPDSLRILDLGTGPGTLAVTLAHEIPQARVTAVDCSPMALQTALKNAQTHGVVNRVDFVEGDILGDWNFLKTGQWDVVLANPPYISTQDFPGLIPDVSHYEPRLALDGGSDGLDFYRRIVPEASTRLGEGGVLVLEVGDTQATAVLQEVERCGEYEMENVKPDYSGRDRLVWAWRRRRHG